MWPARYVLNLCNIINGKSCQQHYSLTCSTIDKATPAYRSPKCSKYQFVVEKKKNYSHGGEWNFTKLRALLKCLRWSQRKTTRERENNSLNKPSESLLALFLLKKKQLLLLFHKKNVVNVKKESFIHFQRKKNITFSFLSFCVIYKSTSVCTWTAAFVVRRHCT